jgi:hypothetical protein
VEDATLLSGCSTGPSRWVIPRWPTTAFVSIPGVAAGAFRPAVPAAIMERSWLASWWCTGRRGSGDLPRLQLVGAAHLAETMSAGQQLPSTTPQQLATAISECVDAGPRVLNLQRGDDGAIDQEGAPGTAEAWLPGPDEAISPKPSCPSKVRDRSSPAASVTSAHRDARSVSACFPRRAENVDMWLRGVDESAMDF